MTLFRSLAMSFAMFSRIPMPHLNWQKANMRYLLAALPVVGVVVGAIQWGWIELSSLFNCSPLLTAAGLVLLPLLITGGIHLDGLADTVDALASHGDAAKKQQILKDPRCGAFAAMAIAAFLIWELVAYAELDLKTDIIIIALIPVLSRSIAALLSLILPSNGHQGLLTAFKEAASPKAAIAILLVFLLAAGAAAFIVSLLKAAFILAALLLTAIYTGFMSKKQFGGISGDIAGYCLQISELAMLTSLMICEKAVMI